MRHTATAIVIVVLTISSAPALAQTGAPPVPHQQILSTNPFGLLFNWFNAEYERTIAPAATLGVSATHFARLEHSNAALVLRWYPQRAALEGFYLGGRAGAYGFETYEYVYPAVQTPPADPSRRTPPAYPVYQARTLVRPGVGIEVGYNWLLGPKRNVSLGLGFGLTRILGRGDSYEFLEVLPNPRVVNIGIAF